MSDIMGEWCKKYPRCIKCPFVGNECVAPVNSSEFSKWVEKMERLAIKNMGDCKLVVQYKAPPPRTAIENKPTPTNKDDAISRLRAMRDQL